MSAVSQNPFLRAKATTMARMNDEVNKSLDVDECRSSCRLNGKRGDEEEIVDELGRMF